MEAVRLDAAVMRGGQPVRNLSANDFVVTDNGMAQQVESVDVKTLPLSVFLVLDTSESVAGDKLASLIDAAKTLIASLRPDDHVALIGFAEGVEMTATRSDGQRSFDRAVCTVRAWADGASGCRLCRIAVAANDESQPNVLIFSDGDDTSVG